MKTHTHAIAGPGALRWRSALGAGAGHAEDAMNKAGCMACHTKDKKLVGPSFKEIAAKYKGQDVVAKLMREGAQGRLGRLRPGADGAEPARQDQRRRPEGRRRVHPASPEDRSHARAGLLAAAAAAPPAPRRGAARRTRARQRAAGAHGAAGLRLLPRHALTGGLGPALTREALADKPLESLAATIFHGRPGTPMPPLALDAQRGRSALDRRAAARRLSAEARAAR